MEDASRHACSRTELGEGWLSLKGPYLRFFTYFAGFALKRVTARALQR